jgi:hypothetical protein
MIAASESVCNLLVKHLVEQEPEPIHTRSGSSSVCSMTEWQ